MHPLAIRPTIGFIVGRIGNPSHNHLIFYLFRNSSRFMSSLVSIVQAARVAGSIEGSGFDSPTASSLAPASGCD